MRENFGVIGPIDGFILLLPSDGDFLEVLEAMAPKILVEGNSL
jgi:hypothetical protein